MGSADGAHVGIVPQTMEDAPPEVGRAATAAETDVSKQLCQETVLQEGGASPMPMEVVINSEVVDSSTLPVPAANDEVEVSTEARSTTHSQESHERSHGSSNATLEPSSETIQAKARTREPAELKRL